jgi:hypothetical protein
MHNIDKVFRPNDDEDHQYRKEPISISKLAKGDASFQDKKNCLGWDFSGRSKTLFVAAHHCNKAITNLSATLQKPWATLNEWQKLLGELRSLTPGLPGSRGLFSFLQESMTGRRDRIKISGNVRTQLETFQHLLASTTRPTCMEELVQQGNPRPPIHRDHRCR